VPSGAFSGLSPQEVKISAGTSIANARMNEIILFFMFVFPFGVIFKILS
jgi:hypothetical protein